MKTFRYRYLTDSVSYQATRTKGQDTVIDAYRAFKKQVVRTFGSVVQEKDTDLRIWRRCAKEPHRSDLKRAKAFISLIKFNSTVHAVEVACDVHQRERMLLQNPLMNPTYYYANQTAQRYLHFGH